MKARFAILCPGQGGQHAAMFDAVRSDARGAAWMAHHDLDRRLGQSLDAILQEPQLLFANRHAQALIVAAGLSAWETLRTDLPAPELIAGYSIGELTAYGVAGAISAEAAIDLAVMRAQYMDGCLANEPEQGLMSVGGLPIDEAAAILQQRGLYVAIETGFDTLIAGGRRDGLHAVQQDLQVKGARTGVLPVGIASHTPLMQAAVAPFADALQHIIFNDPVVPVLAGISGQEIHEQASAKVTLKQQLTQTIRWTSCMDACAERGITVALELGPGFALSRLLRERQPQMECRSLADFRSLAGALKWLQSRLD